MSPILKRDYEEMLCFQASGQETAKENKEQTIINELWKTDTPACVEQPACLEMDMLASLVSVGLNLLDLVLRVTWLSFA